ncbi:hypothetical protein CJO92_17370 (plasmid) [Ralstonia solanacearum]|nr:hypothetical protein CJO92_17370 [Ralstonia solanacearum]
METALKRGAIWKKLGGGAEMTAVRQLKLARDGLVSAKAGLAALDQLTKHAVVDEADEARAELMGYLAMAAISGIETYKRVLNEALKLERPQPRHASAQRESVSGPAFLRQQASLDDMAAIFDELKGYRDALDDYMRLCQAPGTPSATRVSMEAIAGGVVQPRHAKRSGADCVRSCRCGQFRPVEPSGQASDVAGVPAARGRTEGGSEPWGRGVI